MTTYSEWKEMLSTHTRCSEEEEIVRGMPCFRMDLGEVDVHFFYPASFYKQVEEQFPFLEKVNVTYTTEQNEGHFCEKLSLHFVYDNAKWEMLFSVFHNDGMISFDCEDPNEQHLQQLFIQLYQVINQFCREEGVNRLLYPLKEYQYFLPAFISDNQKGE